MLEKEIEKAVCNYATQKKFLNYKFVSPGNKGVPDRLFITPNGTVFFIEFKIKGKPLTKLQKWTCDKFKSYGIKVFSVDNISSGQVVIDEMLYV